MDDTEKLPKNGDKLLDSENMEYEETENFGTKCSTSGRNNVENGAAKSNKAHSVTICENNAKSEGSFACSNILNESEWQRYRQLSEKTSGFGLNFGERWNVIECSTSDEESNGSSSISSNEEKELNSIINLRRRRIYEQIISSRGRRSNNEQEILFSDIAPEESNYIVKGIQDINNKISKLCLKRQCKISSSCNDISGKVNTPPEKLQLSDSDSLFDNNWIEFKNRPIPGFPRFDSYRHRNTSSNRSDLPVSSNRNIHYNMPESPKLKLPGFSKCNDQGENESPGYSRYNARFTSISSSLHLPDPSNHDVYRTNESLTSNLPTLSNLRGRSANLSPIIEFSGPSTCKACPTCISSALELSRLSNHTHSTNELFRLNLSDSSRHDDRITNISPILELSGSSNRNVRRMDVSPSLEIPAPSKHCHRYSHKPPLALNFVDSDSSTGDIQRTKSSKRKKLRKGRKDISFRSSNSDIYKNNTGCCKKIYEEESSSLSDSPKALKRYCAVNTLNYVEGDTLGKIDQI